MLNESAAPAWTERAEPWPESAEEIESQAVEAAPPILPALDIPAEGYNRISLPFLHVQERKLLLATVDLFLAAAWMLIAYGGWERVFARVQAPLAQLPTNWVIAGTAAWLLISWLAGAYELSTADRLRKAIWTSLIVSAATAVLLFALDSGFLGTYPRPALGFALLGTSISIFLWRTLYAVTLRRPDSATRMLLVGDPGLYNALTHAARGQEAYYGVLGFVSPKPQPDPRCLGAVEDLAEVARRYRVQRIVVGQRDALQSEAMSVLCTCIERGVEVVGFTAAYEEIAGKVAVDYADDSWLAALPTRSNTTLFGDAAMRLVDILGALAGLAVTVVLAPLIVLAIYLESGGPILYRQARLGRGGRPFLIVKFRSMRPDAEASGARWARPDDDRITRVGRLLRRTHLDEFPQFWNVLRGDMSLVGPRPERPPFTEELAQVIPFYRLRLAVRPGITGLKQLRVGYAASHAEHLEVLRHDLYYIKHRSLTLNFLIMARTLGLIVGMEGR